MRDLLKYTLAAAWVLAAADPVPKPLSLNTPLRGVARAGEADVYSIDLEAGHFAEIRIQQIGQDVLAEVQGPDGKSVMEIQTVDGGNSEEIVLVSAGGKPGKYLVAVANGYGGGTGSYELKLVALREAAATDRIRVEAQSLRSQAIDEYFEKREEAARKSAVAKAARAVDLFHQAGDELNEAKTLAQWIVFERAGGNYREVVRLAGLSIPMGRRLGNRGVEAQGLFQRGVSLVVLGEGRAGLDQMKEALAIYRAQKEEFGEAFVLNQLSGTYLQLGDFARATEYIDETMALSKRLNNNQLYFGSLMGKTSVQLDTGRFQDAIRLLEEAKPHYERIGDLSNQALVQVRLGRAYFGLGDKEKARGHYERALEINRTVGSVTAQSSALTALAERMRELGNLDRAVEMVTEAAALRERTGVSSAHAAVLGQLANLERLRGNLRAALGHVSTATRMLESERARLGSAGLRATNLSSVYGAFGYHVDILRLLNEKEPGGGPWLEQSFAIAENLRSRGWMETLALAKVDLREGADRALAAQEAELRKKLDDKAAEQRKLLAARAPAAEMDRAAREFRVLSDQYDEVEGRLRLSSPRLAELTQAQPVTAAEVRETLDADTALIEYFVSSGHGFAWVITKEAVSLNWLGPGREIEKLAANAYRLLAARNESPAKESPEARAKRVAEADSALPDALKALSAKLLAASPSIETALAAKKRWLVVPDGPLHLVPVAALPGAAGHEVSYLPSATALRSIRAQAAGKTPGKSIAIVADPVFDAGDPRVTGKPPGAGSAPGALDINVARRAIEAFGIAGADGRIPRLLFTRREAEAIAAAAPSPARKVIDFSASRETALGAELGGHKIIHFATHGLLNSESPELSGLLLSLVDEKGKPKDGLLQLRDIYALKLPVDLVVMSACQTALGKELRGEGVVGLTRGMLFAGASRVVSSLWKVDDAATAELMKLFYAALWKEKLAAAAALQAAQSRLSAQKRWAAPYYWAGFVLQGEYR